MPTTYGRSRPALNASASTSTYPSSNPISTFASNPKDNPETDTTSRSPSPVFNQDWKKRLRDIDNDEYDGEMVQPPASLPLTSVVSSSSLSAAPDSQPAALPRSSPPSSPAHAYRDPDHLTDDPDTSIELNTTVTAPSSDPEDQPILGHADDKDESDDEPAVGRRMSKPLRVFDSESDEENIGLRRPAGRSNVTRLPIQSTSPPTSPGNGLSQLSLHQPAARSSMATTPASSAQKPLQLALSGDSDSDRGAVTRDEDSGDQIEDSKESPKHARSVHKKGLNKAEKSEMAKAQQAIVASRTIRVPDASKRIDPKTLFSGYTSSLRQDEIDSYPFPPGSRARKPNSQKPPSLPNMDGKAAIRRKIGMLPLSAHAAPKVEPPTRPTILQSDPIMGSSQSQGFPALGSEPRSEEDDRGGIGNLNALGALMFGTPKPKGRSSGGDVFGPNGGSDDDLPAASSLFTHQKKSVEEADKKRALAEKKRAALVAQEASRRVASDPESDIELEIASQAKKGKDKAKSRILLRPSQEPQAIQKPARGDVTESQIERAGHAVHFGRDAAQLGSSPVRGGGVYEESQFGRASLPGITSSRSIRLRPTPRKSMANPNNVSLAQLTKHAARKAQADGQARQKVDEERWKASGGKGKVAREEGLKVEDAVRQALQGGRVEGEAEDEGDGEDEEDEDYRGSASESEGEEDKENFPASGRARQPHEPVSDFDGSGGDEEADADKENSLELAGMGTPSPAVLGARSPVPLNDRSPAQPPGQLGRGLSPALSPADLLGRSPSHPRPHTRVSSSGSVRTPLSQLGDEDADAGETENAAVTRAPLGELDVELKAGAEDEEEELPRRPTKRVKSNFAHRLFDDEEGTGTSPSAKLMSQSTRRLGSPLRRLGSPTQGIQSRTARFLSPPSRLRSPLPASGTQSFSQVETQAMLGGLGDVFGFESQKVVAGDSKDTGAEEGDGGLTQLFANTGVATSSAFAALRSDANKVELTQDDRSKLLYRPVLRDDELRRDQELFEREDELMAQPFSPTQREKGTQQWLNERGLWTQTRPLRAPDSFGSTPLPPTQRDTPSPLASPTGSATGRRRIVRRGAVEPENAATKLPSVLDRLMSGARDAAAKEKKKKKTEKSEFVEGEAAESDDEYGDFGPRVRDEGEDEEDEGEEQHVEGLVDDAAMDEQTENAANVQAKYLEQNAEDDIRNEKVAREVITGKYRNRRRGRGDNMDLDDDESDDDGYAGPKKLLKKRKIENDGLDGLEKHESTRPFVEMYNKGIKSADDDDFQHLNQVVDDPFGGAPELDNDEEAESEDDEEDEVEAQTVTPFKAAQKYVPSSARAEVAYGRLKDDSDEEPTLNLPDAAPRPLAPAVGGAASNKSRLTSWAIHEGNNVRVSLRGGQGASVTGHNKNKDTKSKASSFARPTAPNVSSSSSSKLSRLRSKADGFA